MLTYNLRYDGTVAYTTATCDRCKVKCRINSGCTRYIRWRLRRNGWLAGNKLHLCPECNKINETPKDEYET